MNNSLESKLKRSKNEWKWKVYCTLRDERRVPQGELITYGELARLVNSEYGTNIIARNVAALRKELYEYYRRDPNYDVPLEVPLHRIIKKGDVDSNEDSLVTKRENERLRGEEGSL